MTPPPRHVLAWLGGLLALGAGLLLLGGRARASDDGAVLSSLACPAGKVTWLAGTAAPGRALLADFDGSTVGGGSAGADGAWRIPLTVDVPAGIYPVTVVDRQDHSQVAAFICYVDVPVGATPTGTPTQKPTAHLIRRTPSAIATARPTTPIAPTSTAASAVVAEATATTTRVSSAATPSATAVTAPTTATPTTPTATRRATPTSQILVALVAARADDPDDPELFEYVILENQSSEAQELTGWRLVHATTGERYTFPAVTLRADEQLVIWSGQGEDDPTTGALFWPASVGRWAGGAVAELCSPGGQIVSTLTIAAPEGSDA